MEKLINNKNIINQYEQMQTVDYERIRQIIREEIEQLKVRPSKVADMNDFVIRHIDRVRKLQLKKKAKHA